MPRGMTLGAIDPRVNLRLSPEFRIGLLIVTRYAEALLGRRIRGEHDGHINP